MYRNREKYGGGSRQGILGKCMTWLWERARQWKIMWWISQTASKRRRMQKEELGENRYNRKEEVHDQNVGR